VIEIIPLSNILDQVPVKRVAPLVRSMPKVLSAIRKLGRHGIVGDTTPSVAMCLLITGENTLLINAR
jgi:hypothetical protein